MHTLDDTEFSWPVRVYYEDTDAQGIVYYANYLKFMERARTEWLRGLGIDQPALRALDRIFVVTRISADYLVPARFDAELAVTVAVARRGRASFDLSQRVVAAADTALIHCAADVKIACLRAESLRPTGLPAGLR